MNFDRSKRRWTLGGLMVLIAALAVPMAMYARRPRPVEYPERAAWQALADRRRDSAKQAALKAQKTVDEGRTDGPVTGGAAR
jgi:hypothetical protein